MVVPEAGRALSAQRSSSSSILQSYLLEHVPCRCRTVDETLTSPSRPGAGYLTCTPVDGVSRFSGAAETGSRRTWRTRRVWGLCLNAHRAEEEEAVPAPLVVEDAAQQADVADGQPEDLVLTQLLVRWVRRHKAPQLGEGPVHVLLAPAFPAVGEHTSRCLPGTARRR